MSMSVTASSLPPNENQEIIDFLRRLSSMLTGGANADMLSRAASAIEALTRRAIAAEQLLREQQDEHARNVELREVVELASDNLLAETRSLKAQLAESERRAESERMSAAEDVRRLQAGLEDAKARLAKVNAELDALREPMTAIDDSIAIVPVDSLQLARAQFDFLAASFAKNNDVISQTICQIGACAIDKALSDNEPSVKN
jgi:DNA repair exonuclease SbcCD ATPase subunit